MRMVRLRRFVAVLAGFLLAHTAMGSVLVQPIVDCTQRPRIVVMKDGKPVAGAVVELIRQRRYPQIPKRVGRLLRTNKRGEVQLPALSEGEYMVLVTLLSKFPNVEGLYGGAGIRYIPANVDPAQYLKLAEDPAPLDRLTFDLEDRLPPPPRWMSIRQRAAAAEGKPITEHVPEFSGVVMDQGGAQIPKAVIHVVRIGAGANEQVHELKADEKGEFRAKLPDGDYLAVFDVSGFKEGVLAVTIDHAASARELQIALKVEDVNT